jgi:hypothetical protein
MRQSKAGPSMEEEDYARPVSPYAEMFLGVRNSIDAGILLDSGVRLLDVPAEHLSGRLRSHEVSGPGATSASRPRS